ncbi:MAG: DUF1178 family protein [Variovorax sp.]|nr:DUF1178 family protein [Variovorax sp.]
MKVLNLQCAHGHGFEGWFASHDEFESQLASGLVECPLCGDRKITKLLAAPRLNLGSSKPAEAQAVPAEGDSREGRWLQAVRKVIAQTEDVGDRFADEARKMHYGEAEERGIRGQTTREQAQSLIDEGIPVFSLPLPPALKETLQ